MSFVKKLIDKVDDRLERFEDKHKRQSTPSTHGQGNSRSLGPQSGFSNNLSSFNRTPALTPNTPAVSSQRPLQGPMPYSPVPRGKGELGLPTEADVNHFSAIFDQFSPRNGVLSKGQVYRAFRLSRLPQDILNHVWKLADSKGHNELDRTEFVIALHLVQEIGACAISALPAKLPRGYYEACTPGRISAGQQLPSNTTLRGIIDPSVRRTVNGSRAHSTLPIIEPSTPQITIWVKESPEDESKFFPVYKNFIEYHSPVLKSMARDTEVVRIIANPEVVSLLVTWMYNQTLRDKHNCEPFPHVLVYLWVLAYQFQMPDLCNQAVDLYIRMACKPNGIDGPSLQVSKAAKHVYENTPDKYPNSALRRLLTFQHGAFRTGERLAASGSLLPHAMAIDVASFMVDVHQMTIANPGEIPNLADRWRNFEGTEFHIDANSFLANGRPIKSTIQTFQNGQIPPSIPMAAPAPPATATVEPIHPILWRPTWEEKYGSLGLMIEYKLNPKFWSRDTTSETIGLQFGVEYRGSKPMSIQSTPQCTHIPDRSAILWNLGSVVVENTIRKVEAMFFGELLRPGMIELRWETNKSHPSHRKGSHVHQPSLPTVPKILMDAKWVRDADGSLKVSIEYRLDAASSIPERTHVFLDAHYCGSSKDIRASGGAAKAHGISVVQWHLNDVGLTKEPINLTAEFPGNNAKPCMVEITWFSGPERHIVLARQVADSYKNSVAEQVPAMVERRLKQRVELTVSRSKLIEEASRFNTRLVLPAAVPDSENSTRTGNSSKIENYHIIESSRTATFPEIESSSVIEGSARTGSTTLKGEDEDDEDLRTALRLSEEEAHARYAQELTESLSLVAQPQKKDKGKGVERRTEERQLEVQLKTSHQEYEEDDEALMIAIRLSQKEADSKLAQEQRENMYLMGQAQQGFKNEVQERKVQGAAYNIQAGEQGRDGGNAANTIRRQKRPEHHRPSRPSRMSFFDVALNNDANVQNSLAPARSARSSFFDVVLNKDDTQSSQNPAGAPKESGLEDRDFFKAKSQDDYLKIGNQQNVPGSFPLTPKSSVRVKIAEEQEPKLAPKRQEDDWTVKNHQNVPGSFPVTAEPSLLAKIVEKQEPKIAANDLSDDSDLEDDESVEAYSNVPGMFPISPKRGRKSASGISSSVPKKVTFAPLPEKQQPVTSAQKSSLSSTQWRTIEHDGHPYYQDEKSGMMIDADHLKVEKKESRVVEGKVIQAKFAPQLQVSVPKTASSASAKPTWLTSAAFVQPHADLLAQTAYSPATSAPNSSACRAPIDIHKGSNTAWGTTANPTAAKPMISKFTENFEKHMPFTAPSALVEKAKEEVAASKDREELEGKEKEGLTGLDKEGKVKNKGLEDENVESIPPKEDNWRNENSKKGNKGKKGKRR